MILYLLQDQSYCAVFFSFSLNEQWVLSHIHYLCGGHISNFALNDKRLSKKVELIEKN